MDRAIPFTNNMEAYNHVVMTSDIKWSADVVDTEINAEDWNEPYRNTPPIDGLPYIERRFNEDSSYAKHSRTNCALTNYELLHRPPHNDDHDSDSDSSTDGEDDDDQTVLSEDYRSTSEDYRVYRES